MTRLIDISQPVGSDTAVWPGDAPVRLDWTLRRDRGDSVDAAQVAFSVHAGTHVDGPRHTGRGPGAGALELEPFYGPCLVVDARPHVAGDPPRVGPGVLAAVDAVPRGGEDAGLRLLLRTRDAVDPTRFPAAFAALDPALCRGLAERRAVLVGTDAPSVDPVDSTDLEAHRLLVEAGVVNLENLDLTGVTPGEYVLAAFPLRLVEADSAPVRAVLIEVGTQIRDLEVRS